MAEEQNSKYSPREIEKKWYDLWMERGFFHSEPDKNKEPYSIVIPPPNVTGVLHMGHMLNNTIQDVLIRKARMEGKEACWVPGMDHASIATEAKVVAMLKEKGIDKNEISREDFLKHAWEWKEKYGGIILDQLKKLGASCDWERTRFTMDESLSDAVIDVFIDLYKKGHIYRGIRMVNWDPQGKTALSDEEVNYKEVNSKLYYIKYPLKDSSEFVTIATTRPETILGDTAICVNPEDERYKHLHSKSALVPFINREIPVITDDYVDKEFGTGCLKVTPAHDLNDYELGQKHNLETIDILNDDGTLSEKAQKYTGEDRFVVRKKIVKDLEAAGLLLKVEDITNNVGFSERTNAVIEPKLSMQWFCKMQELAKPALENVLNDTIKLHPPKFKNMYKVWMENIRDWCISRQLWWGHRIPAFYDNKGNIAVAKTEEEALDILKEKNPAVTSEDISQDEDVLDTWFSSWLWPISVFDGFKDPKNKDIEYYYPTNALVTAPEILFFWVARMIVAGYEYRDELPFRHVYLHGIVRDKEGRKMSKSLGNSPDALGLIDTFGADGVRVGMLLSAPAGNDLLFDEKLCEQGRNFSNKIWNALRLVKGWEVDESASGEGNKTAIDWFEARFGQALNEIEDHFSKFRISDALMSMYRLVWDDFCSWYLEMIKPEYEKPIDRPTLDRTIAFFEGVLKIMHPFMPFVSEELWHQLKERTEEDCLIVAPWPSADNIDKDILKQASSVMEVIASVRNIRNSKQIPKHEPLNLQIKTGEFRVYEKFSNIIKSLAAIAMMEQVSEKPEGAATFVVGSDELFVPLEGKIDTEAEREKLQKELEYTKGFLNSVNKKLSNERFVNNAPEQVVENEKRKKADAEAKVKALEESLGKLEA